jgi:glycosyltransferase involved in cell wall biosynthesis
MKVAILSYAFAEFCIQQANGLAAECEVLLLLPRSEVAEHQALIDPRVKLYAFDNPRLRQPVRQLGTITALVREIRRFRPDVFHLQHGHLWFNLVLPILRRFPIVVTVHDPRHHAGDRASRKTPQPVMNFGFRRASRVIVHGQAIKEQVCELLAIPASKAHVIPLVAIGNVAAKSAGEEVTCDADDGRTVLFFGRIWRYKGLEYLIRAVPAIARAIPDVRIVIAGQGDDFEPYRRMMEEPERFVVHNRYVSTHERDELFRQASVVVLPYLEATQSGVVPVAYSYAKPVVATETGALSEAVVDGQTGRLVPPAEPAALANAVIELLQNPDKRREMGAAGRRKLYTECSPAVVARQTLDVYHRAIRDHQQQSEAIPLPVSVRDGERSAKPNTV